MKRATLPDLVGEKGIFADGDWVESKDQDPCGDVRLIQLADIGIRQYLNKSARFLSSDTASKLRCTYLKPGDILIARMPDPVGRACIFPGDEKPCVTVVDICILRHDPQLTDLEWLIHLINSAGFRNHVYAWITGTTRQRISKSNLSKIEFGLPVPEKQKHIGAVLGKADAIRRKHEQAIQLADEFISSFSARAFRGKL